jgi:SseB protein N-terminal domain
MGASWDPAGRPDGQFGVPPVPAEPGLPPEVVIVPAHPAEGRPEVLFETRTDLAGRDVLPAFSSVQRLVEAFGEDQPWLALKLHTARELAVTSGLADIVIDPVVPRDAWRWNDQDLELLEESLNPPQSTDYPSETRWK